jgi:transcriptional regulator with XRE-family HTH domain/KaiC/GvpD/RAD55 family RecA-like ATPase
MRYSTLVSTGVDWLDQLLGRLRIGENVVWEVDGGAHVEAFMSSLLEANIKDDANAVYVSFNHSPVTMKEKLGDLFDEPKFILVDCFTDGKGHGDPVFTRFYDSATGADLSHVIRVAEPANVDSFTSAINEIESKAGVGAKYVFDSLTGMQDLWADSARAYRFFTYACPRLYDLKTIAYWILEKEAHSASFRANLRHVTQVVIDLSRSEAGYTLRVIKAEGRALGGEGEAPHRYEVAGDRLRLMTDSRRDLVRLGKLIRSARLQRGMSQAELGELLGVTASTVSQAENGIIALSLSNLFSLVRELQLNLGELLGVGEGPKDSVVILREKDRTRTRLAGSKRKPVYLESLWESGEAGAPQAVIVTMPPGVKLNKHFSLRKGVEFGFVLDGELEVEVAGETRVLRQGDSIYVAEDLPGAWANPGEAEARLLWVVAGK